MGETSMHPDFKATPQEPGMSPELTRAILTRTSGDPCHRLQSLACDFVDGTLEAEQASLVRLHLGHCGACSALVGALAGLQTDLSAMAQVDPGPWFTQAVLRATRHLPIRQGADLREFWWRLMHRPRIALEAAYLGAAAGLMGIYLPMPVPDLALRIPALVQPLGDSALRVAEQMAQAERRTTTTLQRSLRPVAKPRLDSLRRGNLWPRVSSWIKARLPFFLRTPPSPPSPDAEKAPPANPG
ncbi:MAG TPA: hypothetical protein DHV93_02930 [Holophagaceae bacterium]|nr:hypothetical protein [Holophagaceae bacterium]